MELLLGYCTGNIYTLFINEPTTAIPVISMSYLCLTMTLPLPALPQQCRFYRFFTID